MKAAEIFAKGNEEKQVLSLEESKDSSSAATGIYFDNQEIFIDSLTKASSKACFVKPKCDQTDIRNIIKMALRPPPSLLVYHNMTPLQATLAKCSNDEGTNKRKLAEKAQEPQVDLENNSSVIQDNAVASKRRRQNEDCASWSDDFQQEKPLPGHHRRKVSLSDDEEIFVEATMKLIHASAEND